MRSRLCVLVLVLVLAAAHALVPAQYRSPRHIPISGIGSRAAGPRRAASTTSNLHRGPVHLSMVGEGELLQYWFMLPVSVLVATCAQFAGIGGAAFFSPIFLLVFPLLGKAYIIKSTMAAISVALCTEMFGFSSGLYRYSRRGLVNKRTALMFAVVSVPAALAGALSVSFFSDLFVRAIYSMVMMSLSFLLWNDVSEETPNSSQEVMLSPLTRVGDTEQGSSSDYDFDTPIQLDAIAFALTTFGGFLTGLCGVGIGEMLVPQLTRRYNIPVPTAAGTSVLVVFITAMAASVTQVSELAIHSNGGSTFPMNLICMTVPGVVIGGQIGPSLQGKLPQKQVSQLLAVLFGLVGVAFVAEMFM